MNEKFVILYSVFNFYTSMNKYKIDMLHTHSIQATIRDGYFIYLYIYLIYLI